MTGPRGVAAVGEGAPEGEEADLGVTRSACPVRWPRANRCQTVAESMTLLTRPY